MFEAANWTALSFAVSTLALVGNAWYFKPFVIHLPTFALQLSTILAGAILVVAAYRLLAERHGTAVGLLAGATVLLGTPVAFWATTPKRHTVAAMFVVLAVYAFARSRRDGETHRTRTAFRAGAYACAGLLAWVHAPEALVLFVVFVLVDVPTAPDNSPRTLGLLGAVFLVACLMDVRPETVESPGVVAPVDLAV